MQFKKFSDPFHGCEFSALEFDDKSILFDNAFDHESCALGYNEELDAYVIPAKLLNHRATVSLVQAAEILNVSKARVSALCAKGQLKHEKVNGVMLIEWASLDEYAQARQIDMEDSE